MVSSHDGGDRMIKTKQLTDMNTMRVYTDTGDYFGDIEESVLATNKVFGRSQIHKRVLIWQ